VNASRCWVMRTLRVVCVCFLINFGLSRVNCVNADRAVLFAVCFTVKCFDVCQRE
jgi:hypothetical protein